MRVLLVEDEEAVIQPLRAYLETVCNADVTVVRSRDSALSVLGADHHFDLVVCDLRIPTQDGSLDVAEEHGFRVHDEVVSVHPGTFSRFLSGYVSLDNVGKRLSQGATVDVFGTGEPWPLVGHHRKSEMPAFLEWAKELNTALAGLDDIKIDLSPDVDIDEFQLRTLRIYAKRLSGSRIVASTFGGLSSARVLRIEIFDDTKTSRGLVVAKVDLLAKVKDEVDRYQQFVVSRQAIGSFAPLAGQVLHGCGRFGAALYSLAANGYTHLFRLAQDDDAAAGSAVEQLVTFHGRWKGIVRESDQSVGELRSARISDEEFQSWKGGLDEQRVEQVEGLPIRLCHSAQHGDLHGLNVLVGADGSPLTIDYGDLGSHPEALDPVTLELSFLFHAEHPELGDWPSPEQASQWFNLDAYTRDSPIAGAVKACRSWALEVANSQQLATVVYVHAVRQLKYQDTNKDLALTIAKAAIAVILDD